MQRGVNPVVPMTTAPEMPRARPGRPVRIDPSDSERAAAEEKAARADAQVDADDPEALRKAREWDAFKDDNRAGDGNRMNMG